MGGLREGLSERTEIAGENFGELERHSVDFERASRRATGRTILRKHRNDSFYIEGLLKYLINKKGVTQNM